ncbi:oligosaccharide flippase family protein [Acinetobacter baumannii]|uniref:oligosaccharide flippase family protein n=1 Tax=Acinetobacter baumannii TaxID=470 RepID=UPI0010C7F965|nr:oligosaccharide flippase family protein [Acinetobacter baumannii]MBU3097165.1 oligosaccharide flippase family protein [Acinetobacter baumannii]MDC4311198.1 oligosaccharide flippase family protein [Acinetobacter baumannii]MDC4418859.1 oligosaccharide flippase family protein [Acinetobacter baumannii]MDC4595826.1 oligosaccharide flippase family protein [Acinetobacter baumannii]MDC4735858.1 oligosaccharide flippase family protein [Acinetobacter baumannii]
MFKKGIIYILLNYMIQFLNILFNLLLMKYLNSYQLGSLALAKTWQQFVDYSHLGARFSLDRYIPVAKEEEKKYLVATVLFTTFIGALFVFLAAIIFNKADIVVSILTASGVFIAVGNIVKAYYRATNSLTEMLKLVFYNQLLPLLISIVVYFYTLDFNFYLVSLLASYLFFAFILFYRERELFHFIKYERIKRVIKEIAVPSFLLFINSLVVFLYLVMDRFFIDYSNGREELGHYSIILFAFSALMIIPASVAELLFVKIIKQSCESGKRFFWKETLITLGITLVGVIVANFCMDYFVTKYTNYSFLIPQMHMATFAVIPFALTSIYYHVMNGLDLRIQIILINFFTCIGLSIYYFYPILMGQRYDLNYYLYAKICTGWFIFFGYILCIIFSNVQKNYLR